MGKTALIIGFYYQHTSYYEHYRTLSGALIDIYQAYTYCKALDYDVNIIGDFLNEPTPKNVNKAILNGYVDVDILDFCRDYESIITNVTTKYQFKQALKHHLQNCGDTLFVYFSGHGSPCGENLILPSTFTMKWQSFYKQVLTASSAMEIHFVLDCCYAPKFNLPYIWRKNRFRLQNLYASSPEQSIYLFCSSKNDETASSSDNGSLFTRFFFEYLLSILNKEDLSSGLGFLKQHIDTYVHKTRKKREQHMCMYSSHAALPVLNN